MSLKSLVHRVRTFILEDLWARVPSPGWRRSVWYTLRTGVLVVENTIGRELFVRAAALTYHVVLSIVPLIAVMLALLKSLGGLETMAEEVRDFLMANLAPGVGEDAVKSIDAALLGLDARAVSIVGFALLLYTSLSLLSTIEHAFNRMWGVRQSRGFFKRLLVYWTILTVGPVMLALSLAATGFVRSQSAYRWLANSVPFANQAVLFAVPFLLTWIVFALIYKIIPNTRVHWRAALIGSLSAGTAWEVVKRLYVLFTENILASYDVYGPLAAVPAFLIWIYVSWAIVLLGAEMAFATQHVKSYKREVESPRLSHAFKERLAIHLMVEVARGFLAGRPARSAEELSERLKVPVRAGSEVLMHLADAKLLQEVESHGVATYLPLEDPDRISVRRVVDTLRQTGDNPAIDPGGPDVIGDLANGAEEAAFGRLEVVTIKALAEGKE